MFRAININGRRFYKDDCDGSSHDVHSADCDASPFPKYVFHCKDVTMLEIKCLIVNCFYHECVMLMNVIVVCVGYMIEVVR